MNPKTYEELKQQTLKEFRIFWGIAPDDSPKGRKGKAIEDWLIHNIMTNTITAEQIETFIKREEEKLRHAEMLSKKLDSYFFSIVDPRWWSTLKKYRRVVNSFNKP